MVLREGVGFDEPPRRKIRGSDVADLATAHDVGERANDLLNRRGIVPHVQPEQIDIVGAKPPEGTLDGAEEILSMVAEAVWVGAIGHSVDEREFGADDPVVAVALNEFANKLLGLALLIFVRGVEKVAASGAKRIEHAPTLCSIRANRSPITSKCGATKGKLRDT